MLSAKRRTNVCRRDLLQSQVPPVICPFRNAKVFRIFCNPVANVADAAGVSLLVGHSSYLVLHIS